MTHPCQVCGMSYPPQYLFNLKGNVPGGCKVTCLECCGKLEMRERCAQAVEALLDKGDPYCCDPILEDAAKAIRSLPT